VLAENGEKSLNLEVIDLDGNKTLALLDRILKKYRMQLYV
jgi:hypothetical protein